jgi:hypothetical protein
MSLPGRWRWRDRQIFRKARFSGTAFATLIRQRHPMPSCGGLAPTAERTVDPARMIAESLTSNPGIREQNLHEQTSEVASQPATASTLTRARIRRRIGILARFPPAGFASALFDPLHHDWPCAAMAESLARVTWIDTTLPLSSASSGNDWHATRRNQRQGRRSHQGSSLRTRAHTVAPL